MNDSLFMTEFHNQTTLHPLGVITLLLLSVGMLLAPRRYALIPLLVLACSVGPAQRIVLATLDFNFLRVLVAVGMARVLLRNEAKGFRWKLIDSVLVLWAICSTVTATILHATVSSGIYQAGLFYDAIGIYFLCRFLVRDWDDVRSLAQGAAVISVPMVLAMAVELMTARNLFSIFGGVPEVTEERFGRLRCQGPFPHPILAGCFWAVLMPIIGALWWHGRWNRILAITGVTASMLIVLSTASTTPIGGVFFGLIAALAFPFRRWMPWLRWGGVCGLVLVQLVMTNSIWHLLSRIDIVAGSTAWYRYKLIDAFVQHFDDWWLFGSESHSGWWEWGLDDITNQFVAQGIEGGLLSLTLFVAIIVMAFHGVGRSLNREDRRHFKVVILPTDSGAPPPGSSSGAASPWGNVALAWALGVVMFIHCAVFFGVTYFGQAVLVWYLTIGLIGSLAPAGPPMRFIFRAKPAREPLPDPVEASLTQA